MHSASHRNRTLRLTAILAGAFLCVGTTAFGENLDATFSPGHESALNSICGDGRSGRSWRLVEADAEARGAAASMEETVVPAVGRTDIVNVMPMAIIPCIRVIVATDERGVSSYAMSVDVDNVNRDFTISDIHTGEPLQFCPAAPRAPGVDVEPAAASAAAANSARQFTRGHETALNTLCDEGRSGRRWTLGNGAMTETIIPMLGRTDVVRFMPMAIVPCVRVIVATDEVGRTRYDLAVDAENVNRDFRLTDIHTGEAIVLCGSIRSASPTTLPVTPTTWSAIKQGRR